jgi:hypothetical protein
LDAIVQKAQNAQPNIAPLLILVKILAPLNKEQDLMMMNVLALVLEIVCQQIAKILYPVLVPAHLHAPQLKP